MRVHELLNFRRDFCGFKFMFSPCINPSRIRCDFEREMEKLARKSKQMQWLLTLTGHELGTIIYTSDFYKNDTS